jgi:hypothetical protein
MSSLKRFLAHLNEPRPKFECEAAGGSKKRHIEVPISHNLGSPAKAAELALLRKLLGRHAKQVQALYCLHDGLELYGQSDSGELIFHPIHSWSKATSELRREHKDSGRGDDEIHEFERKGVVFGEPAGSGNHLILHQGKVYYANHDGGDDEPLADSFDGSGEVSIRARMLRALFGRSDRHAVDSDALFLAEGVSERGRNRGVRGGFPRAPGALDRGQGDGFA